MNDPANELTSPFTQKVVEVTVSAKDEQKYVEIRPNETVTITVQGVFKFSALEDFLADAECTTNPGDSIASDWKEFRVWPGHFYGRDHLDLMVKHETNVNTSWIAFDWQPTRPGADGGNCNTENHEYSAVFQAPSTGRFYLSIDDDWRDDNRDFPGLDVRIEWPNIPHRLRAVAGQVGYQCNKPPGAAIGATTETVRGIDHARLILDARDDRATDDENGASAAYYEDSGHWGVYTCNWGDPLASYVVTATGTWRYDLGLDGDYALADAECSTGYRTNEGWGSGQVDKFVPYPVTEAYETEHVTSSVFDAGWTEKRFRPIAEGHQNLDYGDLWVNFQQFNWTPLTRNANQQWIPVTGTACSPEHTYRLTFEPGTFPTDRPFHFQLADPTPYYEFDNCGYLQIEIHRVGSDRVMSPSQVPTRTCDPDKRGQYRVIQMKDVGPDSEEENVNPAADALPFRPGYFDPAKQIVRGATETTTIKFENLGTGPHSAKVDEVKLWVRNPDGTKSFTTPTSSAWFVETTPGCSQQNLNLCMQAGEYKRIKIPTETVNWISNTEFVEISYFCQTNNNQDDGTNLTEFGMRGTILLIPTGRQL